MNLLVINILIKRWLLNKVSTNKVKDIITDPSQEKSIFWTRILGMLKTQLPYDDKQCVCLKIVYSTCW